MFNLFKKKRTAIADWEVRFLSHVFKELGHSFDIYLQEVESGLLRGVRFDVHQGKRMVYFRFDQGLVNNYENRKVESFFIHGIEVLELKTNEIVSISIACCDQLVAYYKLPIMKDHMFDPDTIDVRNIKVEIIGGDDIKVVEKLLGVKLKGVVSKNEVYQIVIEKNKLFHIWDLEDGDFIGVDQDGNVVEVTHDPFEIKKLEGSIVDILNGLQHPN